jgi:hypothetical protein
VGRAFPPTLRCVLITNDAHGGGPGANPSPGGGHDASHGDGLGASPSRGDAGPSRHDANPNRHGASPSPPLGGTRIPRPLRSIRGPNVASTLPLRSQAYQRRARARRP